jgi:hypothetical protein
MDPGVLRDPFTKTRMLESESLRLRGLIRERIHDRHILVLIRRI